MTYKKTHDLNAEVAHILQSHWFVTWKHDAT